MNETNVPPVEQKEERSVRKQNAEDDGGSYFGWGVFLVLAGIALFAKEMGWISLKLRWLLPAILVTIGGGYLFEAFKKKK